MGLYSTLSDFIGAYTGLSPAAFFTILAIIVVAYKVVCGMFVSTTDHSAVRRENPYAFLDPVYMGEVTKEELRSYDGSDYKKPLLIAINGQVFDVSRSRRYFGPGGPYASFAGRDARGRDASRVLALMSYPKDRTGNIKGLGEIHPEILLNWEFKFKETYVQVGQLVG
ncbi:membrane steroid-binding protein 2-like [Impatiens glandulifera]|uniref:membrane steroid-binding protein 2-like n=1 Tax=Impatiens glandulifera TaxID=253017 RepID=UPI001FB0A192|nr:membrane steroid-binding protein 2-like [Impatiens glandulifera]